MGVCERRSCDTSTGLGREGNMTSFTSFTFTSSRTPAPNKHRQADSEAGWTWAGTDPERHAQAVKAAADQQRERAPQQ